MGTGRTYLAEASRLARFEPRDGVAVCPPIAPSQGFKRRIASLRFERPIASPHLMATA
jgi:hypothetical protein